LEHLLNEEVDYSDETYSATVTHNKPQLKVRKIHARQTMHPSDSKPLYADNPAWSDVIPIPQHDEGSNPMAPIMYTQECAASNLRLE
jgi:hypothetical protein